MKFSLPYFIALVLMLSTYTYTIGKFYNYSPRVIDKYVGGNVLGAEDKAVILETKEVQTGRTDVFIPPVVSVDESTQAEDKQVVRNSDGTFTEVEKVETESGTIMKVTDLEATGEVIKETFYDLE